MSDPIRILHVIGIMNRGGAETMIMNLYRNIDRTKIQFDFVENSSLPAVFDEEILALGGKIYRCPRYRGINHISYVKWWVEFFEEHASEYGIIHGHLGSTASIYLSIARRFGLYTIAHSHSSGTDHSLKSFLYDIMSYNTRNVADYFFACSEQAGVDRFGEKITEGENYSILNNAINIKQFAYDSVARETKRKELDLISNELVVGHVGRFSPAKNHAFLLDIFAALLRKEENAVLLLVGGGDGMDEIRRKAENLGISDRVRFLGVRSDVADVMQAMDVFAFPSLYEGLPLTLVEAQSSGLPCLISDRIPPDCILTEGLIRTMSLDSSADEWADALLSLRSVAREDHSTEVAAHGFDIKTEAKKLQEFYINAYEQN